MGIYYSQEIIEEVLSRNDIVSVVSEYVKLERKGTNHWGLCPFHNEKTPSFSVTQSKQIYYCFGCQKGGNSIHFISSVENISYFDAIRFLAEKTGIALPEGNDAEEIKRTRLKKEIIEINTEAARFFRENLLENRGALEYFSRREVSDKILRSFGLGFAPDQWDALYLHLKDKHEEWVLMESGLLTKNKNGKLIDRYRNRVMFPIFDIMGKVIAFGGRVLDDSKPKYINSPETPAYHKGRHLYAMNFAKKTPSKQLIIVEGYMDVISLHQAGITNAVASLGTALTDSQGRILKKYCEEVIISYDADGAGQKAAMRGLDILNNIGCMVKVIKVPDGKDPDDYVRKNGADNFNALARKAMSLVEYKAEYYTKDLDVNTLEGKNAFMKRLSKVLASISNMVEREMYIKHFSKKYGVSEHAIAHDVAKIEGREPEVRRQDIKPFADKKEKEIAKQAEMEKIIHIERLLITLICNDNSIFSRISKIVQPDWFIAEENRILSEKVFKSLNEGNETQVDMLLDWADEEKRGIFAQLAINECIFEDNIKAASDIAIKRDVLKNAIRRNEIIESLSNPDIDEDTRNSLKKELSEIIKNR